MIARSSKTKCRAGGQGSKEILVGEECLLLRTARTRDGVTADETVMFGRRSGDRFIRAGSALGAHLRAASLPPFAEARFLHSARARTAEVALPDGRADPAPARPSVATP